MKTLSAGDVVSIQLGIIEHFGVVSDKYINGVPCIISNSHKKGMVVEESIQEFANGRAITVHQYSGSLNPIQIISRARSRLGESYNLIKWNCEHFIRWATGLEPKSPQVRRATLMTIAIMCVFYVIKSRQ